MNFWKNVPINSIVLGAEQYPDIEEDGPFRNLYFRKSEKEGCLLAEIRFEEPIVYSPTKLIDWDILQSEEPNDNIHGHVIILKDNGNLEDDVDVWDNMLEKYWEFVQIQQEQYDQFYILLEFYKGTDLIDVLMETAIKYGKNLENQLIDPKLIVIDGGKQSNE